MTKLEMIESYLNAYNNFDVEGMIRHLHDEVGFSNVSNGEVNLETKGIAAFKAQANQAATFFREREQRITDYQEQDELAEVTIAYRGVLAVDFSEDLKAGSTIRLQGKSIFRFLDGKIILIEDRS
jgi:hypothetical protein